MERDGTAGEFVVTGDAVHRRRIAVGADGGAHLWVLDGLVRVDSYPLPVHSAHADRQPAVVAIAPVDA